ncbi:MAG: RluA family pseudouridine synthase [Armatimonadetes bacterium]|nr:RluA family pseudouridine synthase [Armatimonadota bacterium]
MQNNDDWEFDFEIDGVPDPEENLRPHKERKKFAVLFQDEHLIAFDKASGIATIRERFEVGTSLKEIAEQRHGRLWTVHRIDKDTSGVVLFARDAETHKALNDQFEQRTTIKQYAAMLEGEMLEEEMTIDIPIVTDPAHPGRMKPSAIGKPSLTVLKLRERFRGFTFAEAQPHTGRQHQIRVHCRAVGFPLAVDPMYGNQEKILLSTLKRKFKDYGRPEQPLIDRLTLHAERLTVTHPATGQPLTLHADLPRDMRALLTQLRKVRSGQ